MTDQWLAISFIGIYATALAAAAWSYDRLK